MNTYPLRKLLIAWIPAWLLFSPAVAAGNEAAWTSRDGVTIQASLAGWDGTSFILVKAGRDYRVAPSRLTPECAEKARKLLGLGGAAAPALPPAPAVPRVGSTAAEIGQVARASPAARSRAAALPRDRHGMPEYEFTERERLVRTTAYAAMESDHLVYGDRGAIGGRLRFSAGIRSAAADWSRYPVGTRFRIKGLPYLYEVDDYGSALAGAGTIDLYQPDLDSMRIWGCRRVEIVIVKWGSLSRSERILTGRTSYRHCREMLEQVRIQRSRLSTLASR